jgi:hypothetical protein
MSAATIRLLAVFAAAVLLPECWGDGMGAIAMYSLTQR